MPISDAIAPVQKAALTELTAALAAHFKAAEWGTPGAEGAVNPNEINITLQVNDIQGTAVAVAQYVRITCSGAAAMDLTGGGVGVVVAGAGTNDIIVETDATGAFSLAVTVVGIAVIDLAVGTTQGSGLIDCTVTQALTFA